MGFIIAIILIKYKPIYKVSISGEEVGYIQNKEAFEESIKKEITNSTDKTIDYVDIKITPDYELKLVDKALKTNEQEIGEILGKTEEWARVVFYRGKIKLKEELLKNEI